MGLPGGGGAHIIDHTSLHGKGQLLPPVQRLLHPLVGGIPGGVDGPCEADIVANAQLVDLGGVKGDGEMLFFHVHTSSYSTRWACRFT